MAKTTKKVSKKKTKSQTTEEVKAPSAPLRPAPPVEEGYVSMVMNKTDLATLTNLLTLCASTYQEMAVQYNEQKREDLSEVCSARFQLCFAFANRLANFHSMGEPESRDMH